MLPNALAPLFGAVFTVAVSLSAGTLLLRALGLKFHRGEERAFAFVAGAACLSLAVFVLAALQLARPGVFLVVGAAVIAAALLRRAYRPVREPLPPLPPFWKYVFGLLFAAFAIFYSVTALAPEHSPDGMAYHLKLVSRYLDAHGLVRIADLYAFLPQGLEMLFLYAFACGRHSAAALVHFAFYLALPLLIVSYGRRFRMPIAAGTAALLVMLSPIVAFDGASAYVDAALACVLFSVYYLLRIWDRERTPALLALIGLLAGFAYAIKMTGAVAAVYAVVFVAWKARRKSPVRAAAAVALCSALLMAPWMLRNWIWASNPVAPFFNRWFPNPYIHAGFEREYRASLAGWGELKTKWEIPKETTIGGGRLQGVLGPAFLLAPVALLALRRPDGRQALVAAAVFALPYPANIGTRFLIPPLPFLALAMGLVVAEWKWAAPALVAFHALTCWPPNVKLWCHPAAMRAEKFPWRAALRIEPEQNYLEFVAPMIRVSRMLDDNTPPGARILAYDAPPEAYLHREILVGYHAALNQNLAEMLTAVVRTESQPTRRATFRFPPAAVHRLRIVQTASTADPGAYWSISEVRLYRGNAPVLSRRASAHPNPWEAALAIDGNPMTRWSTWEQFRPGMTFEIDLGGVATIDRVELDSAGDQPGVKLRVEGLADTCEVSSIPAPPDARRLAAQAIRHNGIGYVLLRPEDQVAADVRAHAPDYGFTEIAELQDWRLYRID